MCTSTSARLQVIEASRIVVVQIWLDAVKFTDEDIMCATVAPLPRWHQRYSKGKKEAVRFTDDNIMCATVAPVPQKIFKKRKMRTGCG